MRKGTVIGLAFIFFLAIAARAQEGRSEVSAQGTGFFYKGQQWPGCVAHGDKHWRIYGRIPLSHQSVALSGRELRF
jgi:hypothetical protein